MRVTIRSARRGSAKHNMQTYDVTAAVNIDESKSSENIYRYLGQDRGLSPEKAELAFYNARYGKYLEHRNKHYIAEGHPDRAKTMQQYLTAFRSKPMDMLFQIGDMKDHASKEDLIKSFDIWLKEIQKFSKEHGSHFHVLSMAYHGNEATPHIQVRAVWDYTDKDGFLRVGQDKALEAMGIELPHPDKPKGRYNNRKITWDSMWRERFLEIVQEQVKSKGIVIETEPKPNRRRLETYEYKAIQEEKKVQSLQKKRRKLEHDIDTLEHQKDELEQKILDYDAMIELKEKQIEEAQQLETFDIQQQLEQVQKIALADRLVEVTGQSVEELTHALVDPDPTQEQTIGFER